jgi:PPK2 family polyphosphate:nucleotide phosphotransferase
MAKSKGSTKAAKIAHEAVKTLERVEVLQRRAVEAVAPAAPTRLAEQLRAHPGIHLDEVDPRSTPGFTGTKEEGVAALAVAVERLSELQERLFAASRGGDDRRSVLLVVQGMDTAGKGGIMRHVVGSVDPQGVQITSFKAPTDEERQHDFLWRIRKALPSAGMIGVFDRSHYEDVIIVRVHELVPADAVEERYEQINAFEREVVDAGTTMVKVMLHISAAEQKERLSERLDRPDKHWKYNPGDVDERLRWHDYQRAYEIALDRCSTDAAPWFVVPADRKWYARWAVQHLLLDALTDLDPQWPTADYDVEAEKVRLALA